MSSFTIVSHLSIIPLLIIDELDYLLQDELFKLENEQYESTSY